MKRIVIIHDTELILDSRTQKEIEFFLEKDNKILFCGWNKEKNGENEKKKVSIGSRNIVIENICIKVKKGTGFKENIFSLIKYEIKLFKYLIKNKKNYDYIHACNMDTAFIGLLISKIYKKKMIYDIYDDYADSHQCNNFIYKLIKFIDKKIVNFSDAVIICSEQRKKQLVGRPQKLIIVHNSPNSKKIPKNLFLLKSSDKEKVKIAYVGNLIKGRLIQELLRICIKNKNLELHCGGDGELALEIIEASKRYENIYYYGRLPYEQVLSLEEKCDIIPALYDPSFKNHYYAAPNKFYEALMLGKPIIMVKETGMSEIVEKKCIGEIIDFNEISLEKGIKNLINKKDEWEKISEKMKKIYKEEFSWKEMERRLIKLYEEL